MECPDANGNFVPVKPEPLSEYVNLKPETDNYFGGVGYTHYPVGTLIKAADSPDVYLVASDSEAMRIPDWLTFTTHRFFYEPGRPNQRIVTVSKETLDCYHKSVGNTRPGGDYALVACADGDYVIFSESASPFLRRKVPFSSTSDQRYAPLVKSWGLGIADRRNGSTVECSSSAVMEEASNNDFWVVTATTYRGDDVQQWSPVTKALHMSRFAAGKPFMPLLFGSYDLVIQIPNGTMGFFVSDQDLTSSFQPIDTFSCPEATSQGSGGGISGAGGQACHDTSQRACWDKTSFVTCTEVSLGVFRWSATNLCGDGWECTRPDGQCTRIWTGCEPETHECYSPTYQATCAYNPNTGLYGVALTECGAGYECIAPSTQCAPKAPDPNADPPHTIRCVNHEYTYSMFVTGPVQNGLWSTVSGQMAYLEYGSNSDGWSAYDPSIGSKPSSLWVGDADAQGNPYAHELVMKGGVDQLNLFLYSPDTTSQGWFNLDWSIWTVTGDCWQDGSLIRHTPIPPPSGTITCAQVGQVMKYSIDGPTQMLLVSGSVVGPEEIQYGSNSDGWTTPTTGKITTPWNGTYHHEMSLPAYVDGLNFYLNGPNGGRWFDLTDGDYDGDQWTVAGDCWKSGGTITHAGISASKTIDCQVDGSTMTVTVVGDVTSGIYGSAPTGNPTYLEYGSDYDGWGAYTASKPLASWYASTQIYTLRLNSGVQGFNLFLYDPATGGQPNNWFDLSQWTVTGACYKSGTSISH
jgi:hypothetical protein